MDTVELSIAEFEDNSISQETVLFAVSIICSASVVAVDKLVALIVHIPDNGS